MAMNYNVISNQDWAEFLNKQNSFSTVKLTYKQYTKFLEREYQMGMLQGNISFQSTKNEVTRFLHKMLFRFIHEISHTIGSCQLLTNKNEILQILQMLQKTVKKILD